MVSFPNETSFPNSSNFATTDGAAAMNLVKSWGANAVSIVQIFHVLSNTDNNPVNGQTTEPDYGITAAVQNALAAGFTRLSGRTYIDSSTTQSNRQNYQPSNPSLYFSTWQALIMHFLAVCKTADYDTKSRTR